ncbi:hypothetical protein PIB30_001860 [Stylosanthes scabra]|uniref:AP2/ERF domain-containing protein n=1 Tax=Stylosanthes scabra TaxID=79078 RepID=A0ABU6W6C0_9FABA|nr:hypothetical protein [Stylosanthes scabra]
MSWSSWLHAPSSTTNNKKLKGVRRRKWGKWVSEIRVPGTQERLWLGTYATPEAAAVAHDVAVYCLRRPSSLEKLNFPETLSSYHQCIQFREDLSPRSVQKVASDVAMDVDARNINGSSSVTPTAAVATDSVAVVETNSSGSYDVGGGLGGDCGGALSWWEGLGGDDSGHGSSSSGEDNNHGGGQGNQPFNISIEDYL